MSCPPSYPSVLHSQLRSLTNNPFPLTVTIFTVLFILVVTGLFKYLPHHLVIMRGRAMYYLWGQEGDERILWQWLGLASGDMGKDLYTGGLLGEL